MYFLRQSFIDRFDSLQSYTKNYFNEFRRYTCFILIVVFSSKAKQKYYIHLESIQIFISSMSFMLLYILFYLYPICFLDIYLFEFFVYINYISISEQYYFSCNYLANTLLCEQIIKFCFMIFFFFAEDVTFNIVIRHSVLRSIETASKCIAQRVIKLFCCAIVKFRQLLFIENIFFFSENLHYTLTCSRRNAKLSLYIFCLQY